MVYKDMSKTVKIKMDGVEINAPEGMNIIDAGEIAGIHIPNLCYLKGTRGVGACRLCLVEVEGAKDLNVIEFHTLSKSYNMAGWRLGFVVGNAEVIAALTELKSNIDYGVFAPVLKGGAYALSSSQEHNQSILPKRLPKPTEANLEKPMYCDSAMGSSSRAMKKLSADAPYLLFSLLSPLLTTCWNCCC